MTTTETTQIILASLEELFLLLLIGAAITWYLRDKKKKREMIESKKNSLLHSLSSIPDITISKHYIAPDASFIVGFDDNNKLFIHLQQSDYSIHKYEDIISVQIIRDSRTVFEKSNFDKAFSIIEAAITPATAITSAATSDTYENKYYRKITVKLLLRNTHKTSIELVCFDSSTMTSRHRPVRNSNLVYLKAKALSENISDYLNVIIDSNTSKDKRIIASSLSDEMAKLVELKDKGILSEEEYNQLKSRFLSTESPVSTTVLDS